MTHPHRATSTISFLFYLFLAGALFCAVTTIRASAQTYTVLHTFDETNGGSSYAPLVQANDGNLYGTAQVGGTSGNGVIFKLTPSGTYTVFYNFCSLANCADGSQPVSGLLQATDGNLYGTTQFGGLINSSCGNGCGTIFKITPAGVLTTLHSFAYRSDGSPSLGGLVQGTDGNFYGTTNGGGSSEVGTIFKITPSGDFTVLHNFAGGSDDGANPYSPPVQASDGNFYGVTYYGGGGDNGTIYKITPAGTFTIINYLGFDGERYPIGGLIQGPSGELYGTTYWGGNEGIGAAFEVTLGGTLTQLYSFCSLLDCADGDDPMAGLTLGSDGNFYGVTLFGGDECDEEGGCGTIFNLTPAGTLTTLYRFCSQSNCSDGWQPHNQPPIQATNGIFYGTVAFGGSINEGTVYSLSLGLRPFVKPNPATARVGASVTILGNALTGSSSVTFNGTPATFTVVSPSEITTNVPAGATSGRIEVVTAHGTLRSNINFRILP
ncbi:MAG: choice-of-anchor tandem repeat GloVer-containing protein [Candidatus Sulfotelmatobacter sp.]